VKSILIALFFAVAAAAQTNTGVIGGVVKDPSGAAVPGATVKAVHSTTGIAFTRTTNLDGTFALAALQTGVWDLTVSLPGFSTQTRRNVNLELGSTLTLEFALTIANLDNQITVTLDEGGLPLTPTAEISDVISNRDVVQIPLNGRNFLALAQLSDSVIIPPGGTRGEALQQAGPLPNVGGQRSGHNIYLLDGVKVTDELFNNLVINPSVDSIEEFKIQKSMYPAEFGGKASALINVSTKAGTNLLHGSLFDFYRNDAFDEPNYFARSSPKPPLRQHQFGGAIGGPIKKSWSFFFGSYEGLRMRRSLTKTFSVPSDAIRSGDFSSLTTAITDPFAGGTPFPNNRIPSNRMDPLALAFLAKVPRATGGGQSQTLTAIERSTRNIDQLSLRLDQRFSDSNMAFVRFSTFDADELQPYGTSALNESLVPGFGRTLNTTTRNLALSDTQTLGPWMLNEVRFGWMSVKGGQQSLNRGVDFASQTGLLGVTADSRDKGYPQFSFGGRYSTMGDPTSFTYRDNEHFEFYDNFSINRGSHSLQFGGYYFHLRMRPEQPDNARGAFSFTGQFTGDAFADFLLGYPGTATSGIGRGDEDGRTDWWHLYIQDQWKARRNLTFNIGLRYEHNAHMTDANNRLSSIDMSAPGGRFVIASDENGNISPSAQALLPLIPIPYVTSKDAGWNRGLLMDSPVRLAPRFSFLLSLNDDKTIVRGGYGVFLNQWAYSVQTAFARNLPFFFTKQVDVSVTAAPTLQTRNILTGNATGTIGANIMNHDYKVEYSQTWSGGIQQKLSRTTNVEFTYMGTWTIGADNGTILNVPTPGAGSIASRRPIPQLSRINAIRFDGKSIYHGGTVKVERSLSKKFGFNVSYTLSRSMDDASSPGATEYETNSPQDVRNLFGPGGEWARSSFDHTHQLVASGVFEFPWKQNILEGWRVNPIFTAQTGAPFTVNLSTDNANIGAGPAQRPNQSRDPNLSSGRTPDHWFDTAAFSLPAQFTFGNAPRNSVVGPGYANLDLAVAKTWALGEPARLEFRWETFNVFNRTNFDIPNRTFSANLGKIFTAKSPREMQFGLRLSF
jgi:hypothetical protein